MTLRELHRLVGTEWLGSREYWINHRGVLRRLLQSRGLLGDCHRPACCICTRSAPAAAQRAAMMRRSERGEIGPRVPVPPLSMRHARSRATWSSERGISGRFRSYWATAT